MITTILFSFIAVFNPCYQTAPVDTLTLEKAYHMAYENYPTAKNIKLQEKITALNILIAQTGYYPQIKVEARATYQSEVPGFSFPGGAGPDPISKDQYRASLSVVQNIFSGGSIDIRKDIQQAIGRQKINAVKTGLYEIRKQINQVYYGILLSRQNKKVTQLMIENLNTRLQTVRSRVEHGVLLASQQYILEAELLKSKQSLAEIRSNIEAGYLVLSTLTGTNITPEIRLVLPEIAVQMQYKKLPELRPQYNLFESRIEKLEKQQELAESNIYPQISAFGTFSYGRPGLDILNDDFHSFYIVGLQLKWNFWDLFNSDDKQQILTYKKQQVKKERSAFSLQQQATLDRIREHIEALRKKIERGKKIIALRQKIVKQSAQQLKHGVITSTEYVTELTKANKARLRLFINKVQLAQAQTNYKTVIGLPVK